jgi:hypothetical protein
MLDPDGGRTTYAHDAAGRQSWQVNPLGQRRVPVLGGGFRVGVAQLAVEDVEVLATTALLAGFRLSNGLRQGERNVEYRTRNLAVRRMPGLAILPLHTSRFLVRYSLFRQCNP